MIDMLPDNVLLDIFDFYREDPTLAVHIPNDLLSGFSPPPWRWKTLTQVCRRWRDVIFGSPRRLDLRIVCTETTPTRASLDIWPPFPITVIFRSLSAEDERGVENIIAAVERIDRVSQIVIDQIDDSALEKLIATMHEPFPGLTDFCLESSEMSAVLPESFLGGSAPLLRRLILWGAPFPSFHKFILSATHIVELDLLAIPDSGYIPPETVVDSLATLPNLRSLSIAHRYPESLPFISSLPPPIRAVLPALTYLLVTVSQYSEAFVARIDSPLLNQLNAVFFTDLVFEIKQLHNFISRIERLEPFNRAYMKFLSYGESGEIRMILQSPTMFELTVMCETPDWDLSSTTQIFSRQLSLLSHVEELEIREDPEARFEWKYDSDRDPSQWLGLFHLFIAVQSLYVSNRLVPPVSVALQELTGERTMEVLPALRNLFLEGLRPSGPAHSTIMSFAASRKRSDHLVSIQRWDR